MLGTINTFSPVVGGVDHYDRVIRTQKEFEALIASPTWLDAKSVCFVGDGGTLMFTRETSDGLGVKIPQTVKRIQGMNNATIEVLSFKSSGSNAAGLYYTSPPSTFSKIGAPTLDYSISDIHVRCDTSYGNCSCFANCVNLINCDGWCNSETGSTDWSYCFIRCNSLINCRSSSFSVHGIATGFTYCYHLVNCHALIDGRKRSDGYNNCNYLLNCSAVSGSMSNSSSIGNTAFGSCCHVTNCDGMCFSGSAASCYLSCENINGCNGLAVNYGDNNGTAFKGCYLLSNCIGGAAQSDSNRGCIGFSDCSYLNGCKLNGGDGNIFLSGTNTKVDTSTMQS